MVRGNWQKRVEMADARRKEGKQKKLRDQDKRVYKKWMQDFLVQIDNDYKSLDNNNNTREGDEEDGNQKRKGQKLISFSSSTLHVWSDTMPPTIMDNDDSNRQEAFDMTTTTTASSSSGGRTPSSFRKNKKKLHPRSKELEQNKNHHHSEASSSSSSATTNSTGDKLLCKRHFFHGKGSSGRQADNNVSEEACMLTTMAAILKRANDKSQLDDAYNAATSTLETADYMDMVYYIPIDLKQSTSSLSVSDLISAALAVRSIPLSSIVYVALQDTLLYDRYRNGSITPCVGDGVSNKMSDVHESHEHDNNINDNVVIEDDVAANANHDLPNAILEHILTYLPDTTAVTVLSRVCKAWHREISSKSASPNLWIHLLQRQGWPVLLLSNEAKDDDNDKDNNNAVTTPESAAAEATTPTVSSAFYREQYIKHYLAMRNVRALSLGVSALLGTTRYNTPASPAAPGSGSSRQRGHGHGHHHHYQAMSIPETEMSFFDLTKRRKFTPKSANDTCVALLEWSPQHILAAYAQDCTLRLFQAVRSNDTTAIMMMNAPSGRVEPEQQQNRRGGGGGSGLPEKRCKELICLNIDPYRSTKKRTCTLESVAIDAEYIGCLCSVSAENVLPSSDTHAAIIVLTSRDDFLLGECSSSATKVQGGRGAANANILEDSKVIDIGESVLNFLLSSNADNTDHQYMPLMDFLSNGGEIGDVSIKTSWNLVACKHGRFLVEVSIGIPPLQDDNFDQDAIHQLDRKVVLFSANAGSMVLWMGESYPMHTGSLPPAHNSAMVMAGCSFLSTSPLQSPRPSLTVAIRSELEPSILVYEMDCYNVRTRRDQQEEQTPPRFVEESCLARNEILAQLAAATTISGDDGDEAQQVEWRVHPSQHLLLTSTDIVAVDFLQRHIIQVAQQNVNDVVPNRTSQIRERKTILSFYPHGTKRASSSLVCDHGSPRSSYDLLALTGMLEVEDMMNDERNDHIIVLCTELQKKERRGRGRRQQVLQGVALEENGHDSDEEGEDAGGLDGEWFGTNQDVSHCWEESLVLVVVHVPSRREIGRKTLPETKVILTTNQAHDYDSRSYPSSWRPRLSSVSAGGTLGLALNAAGIILTGDDVRCLGTTDRILLFGPGGENAEHRQSDGKKKKKKGKKTSGGKKDGFARGMSPW